MQFEQCSVVIDSDEEDIDGGFSCLINENTKGMELSKLETVDNSKFHLVVD